MKNLLFIMAVIMITVVSCTSRSERLEEEIEQNTFEFGNRNYPVFHMMNDKTAFEYHDKQDMVRSMLKTPSIDTILISRITIIHSDSTKDSYFGEWHVPAYNMTDTTYQEIIGTDTITNIVEVLQFARNRIKLHHYKEEKPY